MQSPQMHILVATRYRAMIGGPQSYVLGLFQSWQPAVTSRGSSTSRVKPHSHERNDEGRDSRVKKIRRQRLASRKRRIEQRLEKRG